MRGLPASIHFDGYNTDIQTDMRGYQGHEVTMKPTSMCTATRHKLRVRGYVITPMCAAMGILE